MYLRSKFVKQLTYSNIMKSMYVFLVAAAMFLASCMASHTCPTYMKKDTNKEAAKRA